MCNIFLNGKFCEDFLFRIMKGNYKWKFIMGSKIENCYRLLKWNKNFCNVWGEEIIDCFIKVEKLNLINEYGW